MAAAKDIDAESLEDALQTKARIVELSSEDEDDLVNHPPSDIIVDVTNTASPLDHSKLPQYLLPATLELFHEDLETNTSETQQQTTDQCLPLLYLDDTQGLPLNSHGMPQLRRANHIRFLHNSLAPMPAPYAVMDASRPWLFYWSMAGLTSLGEDVSSYKQRLIDTLKPLQNPTGGFGGGHGQLSHCACTYAALLALAAVDGLSMIDRKAMWHWLGTIKQASGGFRMAVGAEEDVRGAYCAMTILTLLNLPLTLPEDSPARTQAGFTSFTDNLGEWIGRCQTYEGSIAGSPTNEAHGAYAFCALACLSILDAPAVSLSKYLDLPALIRNLASLQTQPEGGFAGRTNKLVDACYSHWVGGCWSLIEAAAPHRQGSLWSRAGLIRYLLTCCQNPQKRGGMRDKPSAHPDAYHTCYSLSGLSAAQNHYHYVEKHSQEDGRLMAAFNWSAEKAGEEDMADWMIDERDVVNFVHPVFVIPFEAVERARVQFEDRGEDF